MDAGKRGAMSTKATLKYHREEQGEGWFHLYRECFDEENTFVYLELGGVSFQAASSAYLDAGTRPGSVAVRIPEDWARRLGLVEAAAETEPRDAGEAGDAGPEREAAPPANDEYAQWLLDQRGTVSKDIDLEDGGVKEIE